MGKATIASSTFAMLWPIAEKITEQKMYLIGKNLATEMFEDRCTCSKDDDILTAHCVGVAMCHACVCISEMSCMRCSGYRTT